MAEIQTTSALLMDRSDPLGNSLDVDGRRSLHTKIKNSSTEPVYVSQGQPAGETLTFKDVVGLTPVLIPAVQAGIIIDVMIRAVTSQVFSNVLKYSFDGVNFLDLSPGEFIIWSPLGGKKQVTLKANAAGVAYEILINRAV